MVTLRQRNNSMLYGIERKRKTSMEKDKIEEAALNNLLIWVMAVKHSKKDYLSSHIRHKDKEKEMFGENQPICSQREYKKCCDPIINKMCGSIEALTEIEEEIKKRTE
jgi:hypothetical protein